MTMIIVAVALRLTGVPQNSNLSDTLANIFACGRADEFQAIKVKS